MRHERQREAMPRERDRSGRAEHDKGEARRRGGAGADSPTAQRSCAGSPKKKILDF
jgi:hypothetical protein